MAVASHHERKSQPSRLNVFHFMTDRSNRLGTVRLAYVVYSKRLETMRSLAHNAQQSSRHHDQAANFGLARKMLRCTMTVHKTYGPMTIWPHNVVQWCKISGDLIFQLSNVSAPMPVVTFAVNIQEEDTEEVEEQVHGCFFFFLLSFARFVSQVVFRSFVVLH